MFGVDLTAEEVYFLYKPSSKKSEVGYFFLASWENKKIIKMNLSSSCEGWKDKNFWVRGNFDPFSSVEGVRPVPMNYNVLGKHLTALIHFFFVSCRILADTRVCAQNPSFAPR